MRVATPAGIGAFLAHLGLQSAEGIGVVVGDIATAGEIKQLASSWSKCTHSLAKCICKTVTLGGCPPEKQTKLVAYDNDCAEFGICIPRCVLFLVLLDLYQIPSPCNQPKCIDTQSDNYTCDVEGGVMSHARTWLGILGLMIIAVSLAYKSKMSFVYGVGFVTIISWFRGTAVTYFPYTEAGNARFDYFKQVVDVTGLDMIIAPFTSDLANAGLALFTMVSKE